MRLVMIKCKKMIKKIQKDIQFSNFLNRNYKSIKKKENNILEQ